MNEKGIVVAVDRMLEQDRQYKINGAQQKMYAISNEHPLAILSLGTRFFINYPVHTLVKMFAAMMKDTYLDGMVDYVNHFITFIEELDMIDLGEEIEEKNYILGFINNRLRQLNKDIQYILQVPEDRLAMNSHEEEIEMLMQKELTRLNDSDYLPNFSDEDCEAVLSTYDDNITSLIKNTIKVLPLSEELISLIKNILVQSLLKKMISQYSTVFLFIGYGDKEVYPTICELQVEGRVNQKLKFSYSLQKMFTEEVLYSGVQPLGDAKEPLNSFTSGIAERVEAAIFDRLHKGTEQMVANINAKLHEALDEVPESVAQLVNNTFSTLPTTVIEEFNKQKYHISEKIIYQNINRLSLEQLAFHAEHLLKLADLKHVLHREEMSPLGISVNVAIIDKIDGFRLVK